MKPRPDAPARSLQAVAWRRRGVLRRLLALGASLAVGLGSAVAVRAAPVELLRLEAVRQDHGVTIEAAVRFELPPSVEDALQKGVALHFVAEAELLRSRWYWRDQRIARVVRTWRLSYQPLTFTYRVSFGGLSQNYASLGEALRVIQRAPRWRLAEGPLDEEARHYVEYSFRLDTNQLPRPMLIGLGGQAEWSLLVERTVPLPMEPRG